MNGPAVKISYQDNGDDYVYEDKKIIDSYMAPQAA